MSGYSQKSICAVRSAGVIMLEYCFFYFIGFIFSGADFVIFNNIAV